MSNDLGDLGKNDCDKHGLLIKGIYSRMDNMEKTIYHDEYGIKTVVTRLVEWHKNNEKQIKIIMGMQVAIFISIIGGIIMMFFKGGS